MTKRLHGVVLICTLLAMACGALVHSMPTSNSPGDQVSTPSTVSHQSDFVDDEAEYRRILHQLQEEATNSIMHPQNFVGDDAALDELINRLFAEESADWREDVAEDVADFGSETPQRGEQNGFETRQESLEESTTRRAEYSSYASNGRASNDHLISAVELAPKSARQSLSLTANTRNLIPERDECPICLEDYGQAEEIKFEQCSHKFHKGCLSKWADHKIVAGQSQVDCPICRRVGVHHPNRYST